MNKVEWICVDDRLPETLGLNKYYVKIECGSVTKKVIEKKVLGRMSGTGFRFLVGDWQVVTHWAHLPEPP